MSSPSRSRRALDAAVRDLARRGEPGVPLERDDSASPQRRLPSGSYGELAWEWNGEERGLFAGRGPKGYRRSDERIREDVHEALTRDGELDASEIVVSVDDGEVTLEGAVPDRRSKRLAEDLAEQRGVRDVHNRLRVEEGG